MTAIAKNRFLRDEIGTSLGQYKTERMRYLRRRFSKYSDAANAEKATTATPLNSGTGMLLCS